MKSSMSNRTTSNFRPLKWIESLSGPQFFFLVYLIALIPRLIFVLATGKAPLSLDEIEYDHIAWYLSEGKGFLWFLGVECTYRPPLFPFLLSIIYCIAGPDYYVARICLTFISATQGYFTYFAGKEVFPDKTARLAGLFVALYLPFIFYSRLLMPENVFISCLLLLIHFLLKLRRYKTMKYAVYSGIFLVFSIFLRPSFTLFIVLIIPWLFLSDGNRRVILRNIACVLLITIIPAAVWSYRNYLITDQFVFLDTRTGPNLYIGYNENATGRFEMDSMRILRNVFIKENIKRIAPHLSLSEGCQLYGKAFRSYKDRKHLSLKDLDIENFLSDVYMHNYGRRKAFEYIKNHPIKALCLVPRKIMYFWNIESRIFLYGYSHGAIGHVSAIPLAVLFFLLLTPFVFVVLSALYSLIFYKMNAEKILFLLPILYYTALHALTFGGARFHYPIVPLLSLFAANTWTGNNEQHIHPIQNPSWKIVLFGTMLLLFIGIWWLGIYESMDKWHAVFMPHGHRSRLPF